MKNSSISWTSFAWAGLILVFGLVPVLKTSDYQLILASHILVWGLFATAFNMLFGLTGMLSFGQALFYGAGAYSIGLMVKYMGTAWFLPGLVLGVAIATVLAYLLGFLVIRVSGVFFTVLTLAFGQLAWQVTFKWYEVTGGDDGIQGIIPPGILENKVVYYYLTCILVIASIWFLKRVTYSPMGLIMRGIRQNPERVRFIGRSVRRNQIRIYVISGFFCSLAGGLMSGIDNSIHTDMLHWTTSGEVILVSVLGGIYHFFGPFIGAAIMIMIKDIIGAFTEYWSLIIGLILAFIVILSPSGILGELHKVISKWKGTAESGG